MERPSLWFVWFAIALGSSYWLDGFWLDRVYIAIAFALCVASFDMASGFAGLKSFGPVIPFALSAYGYGVLDSYGPPFLLSVTINVVGIALLGLVLSEIIFFRRSTNHTAWAVAGLVGTVALEQLAKLNWVGLGGSNGMLVERYGGSGGTHSQMGFHFAFCVVILIGFIVIAHTVKSNFGVKLLLSQYDPVRLASIGASRESVRRQAILIQWGVSAAAGASYASAQGIVDPSLFGIDNNLTLLVAAVIFGERTILRPAIAIFGYLMLETFAANIVPGLQTLLLGLLLIAKVGFLGSDQMSKRARRLSIGTHGTHVFNLS